MSRQRITPVILVMERRPAEGRPLMDKITASQIANLNIGDRRQPGRSEIRILLSFDPWCC
jgi:hypothetical protein